MILTHNEVESSYGSRIKPSFSFSTLADLEGNQSDALKRKIHSSMYSRMNTVQ